MEIIILFMMQSFLLTMLGILKNVIYTQALDSQIIA